jgi:hypothetical protein
MAGTVNLQLNMDSKSLLVLAQIQKKPTLDVGSLESETFNKDLVWDSTWDPPNKSTEY